MSPILAQQGCLLDQGAIRTAQQQCVSNSPLEHVIVVGNGETFQLALVVLQVLTAPRCDVTLDEVHQAPTHGLSVPVINMLGPHQLQRHLIRLVDRSFLSLDKYVLARDHFLMPSVSSLPTSPTRVPGEHAVISGAHFAN